MHTGVLDEIGQAGPNHQRQGQPQPYGRVSRKSTVSTENPMGGDTTRRCRRDKENLAMKGRTYIPGQKESQLCHRAPIEF